MLVAAASDPASEVTAIVVAVGTLVLAIATIVLAMKTKDLAEKTAKAVEQGEAEFALGREQLDQATRQVRASQELIEEARHDRELAARPAVSVQRPAVDAPPERASAVTILNVGNGPAIGCRFIERYGETGRMTTPVDVAANSSRVTRHAEVLDDPKTRTLLIWVDAGGSVRFAPAAVFAKDILGNCFQFILTRTRDDRFVVDRTEMWPAGAAVGGPEWAVSDLVWPNNWSRWAGHVERNPATGSEVFVTTETIPGDGGEVHGPPQEVRRAHPVMRRRAPR